MLEFAIKTVIALTLLHGIAYFVYRRKRQNWTYKRSYRYGFFRFVYYFATFYMGCCILIATFGALSLIIRYDQRGLLLPVGILMALIGYGFRRLGAHLARWEEQRPQ